jgi:hypothetical protein
MTLPFRRRHHDDDASHDRARALMSAGFIGPLPDPDQAWLDDHVARCPECRADQEGYLADRALLQSLRDAPPAPPRDLWARTAAAIEREGRAGGRRGIFDRILGPLPRGVPVAPLAGVLVAAVVLVVALMPPGQATLPPTSFPSDIAGRPATPGPTALSVDNQVAYVQAAGDGHYTLVITKLAEVCPTGDENCAPLPSGRPTDIQLAARPQAVVLSPDSGQVAVVTSPGDVDASVIIVSVATPLPTGGSAAPSVAPSVRPTASAVSSESPAGSPVTGPSGAPAPNGHAIIRGVVVVGSPAYSDDGAWFAFSARPRDGSAGPDLYAWHVGDDAATRLTTDGATYFSGWYDGRIVASSVQVATLPDATSAPSGGSSGNPVSPAPSAATPAASEATVPASPSPALEAHPASFLLDPATGARTRFARDDVWLPSIDRTGRFVAYWSGTITPSADGHGWRPATGSLVLDGWSEPIATNAPPTETAPSGEPTGSEPATSTPPTAAPATTEAPTTEGTPAVPASLGPVPSEAIAEGPAGTTLELAAGPLADFDVRFDPTGTRLAVWTADPADTGRGPLWLLVLDPIAGGPNPTLQPLPSPGIVVLRGFALDEGRLGWVTPAGQNGQPSSVQVLAWKDDAFGQIQTVPGSNPQIVR